MTDSVQWAEPPKSGTGNRYNDLRDELRRNPGRWALLGQFNCNSSATGINQGRGGWTPKGAFAAVGRSRPDHRFDVYVRYVGDSK